MPSTSCRAPPLLLSSRQGTLLDALPLPPLPLLQCCPILHLFDQLPIYLNILTSLFFQPRWRDGRCLHKAPGIGPSRPIYHGGQGELRSYHAVSGSASLDTSLSMLLAARNALCALPHPALSVMGWCFMYCLKSCQYP
jgi:hypothetical protein